MLLNILMHDGSRHFADLPEHHYAETAEWHLLRAHVAAMPGAQVTRFLTDEVTEAWLDWSYRGHAFSANNPLGEWWLFVRDPACPDEILHEVVDYLARLLGR